MEYLVSPILLLISTPIFINVIGLEQYGQFVLLLTFVGISGFLNSGTGLAAIRISAETKGQASETVDIVQLSVGYAVIGSVLFSMLLMSFVSLFADSLFAKMGDRERLIYIGLGASAVLLGDQLDAALSSCLKGHGLFGANARAEVLSKATQYAVSIGVAVLNRSLKYLVIGFGVGAIFKLSVRVSLVIRLMAVKNFYPKVVSRKFINTAFWGWIQGLGGVVLGFTDRIIVASVLGPIPLSVYVIASQLAVQVHTLPAAAFSILLPKYSKSATVFCTFQFYKVLAVCAVFSIVCALSLILGGELIIKIWLGEKMVSDVYRLIIFLSVAYLLQSLSIVPYYFLMGVGQFKPVVITSLSSGLIILTLTNILGNQYGLDGVGIARIIAGIVSFYLILASITVLKMNHKCQ